MPAEAPTTEELKSAWDRARILRLRGWTFAKAMATPLLRISLEKSAVAHRREGHYHQPRLI